MLGIGQLVVSFISVSNFGYKSLAFAAMWSLFLIIGFIALSSTLVSRTTKPTEFVLGTLIGFAAMLAELFFVLMVISFTLGSNAGDTNNSKLERFMSPTSGFSSDNVRCSFRSRPICSGIRRTVVL